jgi:acetyl esterase/lipase
MIKSIKLLALFAVCCVIVGFILLPKETKMHMFVGEDTFSPNVTIRSVPNIKYGDDPRQMLDIYMPYNADNCPVLFFVHGGGWSFGSRKEHGDIGCFYAKKGFVVVVVDHRLSPEVSHPKHVQDVAKALAWTEKNITNYGGSFHGVYLLGYSSGAHLVTLLATNEKYLAKEGLRKTQIQGVIAVSGIYRLGSNISLAGFSSAFPYASNRLDASPINFIKKDEERPGFLIIYAQNDIITLSSQAQDFYGALRKADIHADILCAKGHDHFSVLKDCVNPKGISNAIIYFMGFGHYSEFHQFE